MGAPVGLWPVALWWMAREGAALDAPDDGGEHPLEGGGHLVVDLVAQVTGIVGHLAEEGVGGVPRGAAFGSGGRKIDSMFAAK